MWQKRAKIAAFASIAVLAMGLCLLTWLWNERPSLTEINWPAPEFASTSVPDTVTATWLGITTLLFDDGETQILIDGFFSRPTLLDAILDRPVDNDAATINYALDEFRMRRLAAIIPGHSHFDHAMDVGAIANRTSASIIGSPSTAEIARGAGVPEDQITLVAERQPYEFGRFTVTLLRSRHAPIGWRGAVPIPGTIDTPLATPAPISAWREGGSYTIVIEHPEGTTVVQASSGFADGLLEGISADVVMLGVGGVESLGRDYAERYWQTVVTTSGAQSVYPIHFDDFTLPFGEIEAAPRFLSDFVTMADWMEAFRDRWDTGTKLLMPEFGKPIVLYPPPPAET
jgi:L-ascorbate metabolism protein UlaG (beta-lactamase superfamily)